jgi:hypothetical protein
VVVSDVWRRGTPAAILQQLDLQVEAMTPAVAGGHGAEIEAFFSQGARPVHYVILSCAAAESMPEALREHLVTVDPAVGLTLENFQQALDILGVACPSTVMPAPKLDAGLKAKLAQLQQLARENPARFGSALAPAHEVTAVHA